jgi:hypothetical protein
MTTIKVAPRYSEEFLEVDRPQPLSDKTIESLIEELLPHKWGYTITDEIYNQFKDETEKWILASTLNNVTGLETFYRKDVCIGCTQFIDTIYTKGPVQVISGDYRYHQRLGLAKINNIGTLTPNMPLIIAMPFPSTGSPHNSMDKVLQEAIEKNIPVHIDAAWLTCCRDINFNFDHPAIRSVAVSLSKGLGLGWNRIGVRWTKDLDPDAITIMNDFKMNNRALTMIGLHFIRQLPTDYLWNKYGDVYYKICKDFNLEPTNAIYLALRDGNPVGISPLIRYVTEQ